jgi:uncharacterized protein (TIGR02246 family)
MTSRPSVVSTVVVGATLLVNPMAGRVSSAQQAKITASAEEHRITQVLGDMVDAWNRNDAGAFARVFADDAEFTNVRGAVARGRADVERHYLPMFETTFKGTTQTIEDARIRFIRPDVASVDALRILSGLKAADGQPRPATRTLLGIVMTWENDRWLIASMHNIDMGIAK